MSKRTPAQPVPHSWAIESWPASIHPGTASRGRYVVRANRDALIAAGALARVGRSVIVLGVPYCRWLESQQNRVSDFEIAPNRSAAEAAL